MEPNEIHAKWRELEADLEGQNKAGEMPSVETNTVVPGGKVRLALSEHEFCALLLPVSITDSVDTEQVSQLVSVRSVTLGHKGKQVRFIEVRCEEKNLNEVFARVVSDILRRIELGVSGIKSVDEALNEFRKLLNKQHERSIDEKTVIGLIGELLTLIEVLEINAVGLSAWHGPDSDRHDFRAGPVTVEVKTSLGADGNKIHINGIRQLESVKEQTFLLRHIRIEPDPDGNLSVPDLVAQASALLSDQNELDEKLEKLGYTSSLAEAWQSKRYRKVGMTAYEVTSGFPRLIPDMLKVDWPVAGVSSVSYEVDLGAAASCKVDDEYWQEQVQELCKCS